MDVKGKSVDFQNNGAGLDDTPTKLLHIRPCCLPTFFNGDTECEVSKEQNYLEMVSLRFRLDVALGVACCTSSHRTNHAPVLQTWVSRLESGLPFLRVNLKDNRPGTP